ncbi:MAG: four helix bundle protein [Candidatus Omnitrophota bacterium]
MINFRFQDLDIWKEAIDVADKLFDIADGLETKKMYRFAEQLRGAAMSVSNNIAEGSGSTSNSDFINFLKFSRRSIFENANILILLEKRGLVRLEEYENLLKKLDSLSRKITNFQKSLK